MHDDDAIGSPLDVNQKSARDTKKSFDMKQLQVKLIY